MRVPGAGGSPDHWKFLSQKMRRVQVRRGEGIHSPSSVGPVGLQGLRGPGAPWPWFSCSGMGGAGLQLCEQEKQRAVKKRKEEGKTIWKRRSPRLQVPREATQSGILWSDFPHCQLSEPYCFSFLISCFSFKCFRPSFLTFLYVVFSTAQPIGHSLWISTYCPGQGNGGYFSCADPTTKEALERWFLKDFSQEILISIMWNKRL